MSKRAKIRALEVYPLKDYNKEPNYVHTCDTKMLDEVYREVFKLGYVQAEKDTIERAVKWMKKNWIKYPNSDIPTEVVVDNFKKAMEEEK